MNIGVEVLKESVIRVQSQLNDWMDCVFVVSKDDTILLQSRKIRKINFL